MKDTKDIINVFSEIGELKKVLIHTPGNELKYVSPYRLDELLFSNVLEWREAKKEHNEFIQKLKSEGVEPVELTDLVAESFEESSIKVKNDFIRQYLDEATPILDGLTKQKLLPFFLDIKHSTRKTIELMMSGITQKDISISHIERELIIDPMPNLYFSRDNFISIGNSVIISNMKYKTRKRETIFTDFIFKNHPLYKKVNMAFERKDLNNQISIIEGGDVLVYSKEILIIGISERTTMSAILELAENFKKTKRSFKKIYGVEVPKMKNLMHLDTWLTMIDYDKFIYSPNVLTDLKFWEINLDYEKISSKELHASLSEFLKLIIGKDPILIPIGGKGASQITIDIETNFVAANYLVIRPGVVIGYSRNYETQKALEGHGVKVIAFEGNQLSLGMGSSRCMSMPLIRSNLK
ncbi:arginine deiminase family protein [[Mycoplasma] mobile]|uniref:Arginine demininase n=1 Tax=Mycoplasma mobile (strain ATCC 43663 / 163K / NCTC 11711) TaxID=267748 RepID=Q6KI67_MYCM1|nr:arginine deiminase family protein [[Mycoplasma] mobile]AAT27709.1 arginine demininase [Mycoplasma mobile 163K]